MFSAVVYHVRSPFLSVTLLIYLSLPGPLDFIYTSVVSLYLQVLVLLFSETECYLYNDVNDMEIRNCIFQLKWDSYFTEPYSLL